MKSIPRSQFQEVNSKKSGRKNHRRRRRIKKNHDVPNNSRYRFAAINNKSEKNEKLHYFEPKNS